MAFVNVNKPAGLSPIAYLNGANYDGRANTYGILAANTNPFYPGDIVKLVNGGMSNGVPSITLATPGDTVIGVVIALGSNGAALFPDAGPYVNPQNMGNILYRPTGAQATDYYALVSDDPNIIYEVQEGGAGTNYTKASVGRYAPFLYAAPTNPAVNPVSNTVINNAAATTTAVGDLFLYRFVRRIDNNFVTSPATGGGAQKWQVLLGRHQFVTRPAAN
jgi:hypothetical protein